MKELVVYAETFGIGLLLGLATFWVFIYPLTRAFGYSIGRAILVAVLVTLGMVVFVGGLPLYSHLRHYEDPESLESAVKFCLWLLGGSATAGIARIVWQYSRRL